MEKLFADNFYSIVKIWILVGIVLFPALLRVKAPYGRHSSKKYGALISNRWGWFIMEIPSFLLVTYFVFHYGDLSNALVITAAILWMAHYFHRAVIFPMRIHTSGKKMPVLVMSMAFLFNLVNGSINGYWLGNIAPDFSFEGIYLLRYIIGVSIFVTGFIINQYHDKILIGLRKARSNGYQIPYGGLFNYVSCPNFLGEIIEWIGFAILCWSLPALAFGIWTSVNLIPRAIDHHKWYKSHFENYPSDRKAILPKLV